MSTDNKLAEELVLEAYDRLGKRHPVTAEEHKEFDLRVQHCSKEMQPQQTPSELASIALLGVINPVVNGIVKVVEQPHRKNIFVMKNYVPNLTQSPQENAQNLLQNTPFTLQFKMILKNHNTKDKLDEEEAEKHRLTRRPTPFPKTPQ